MTDQLDALAAEDGPNTYKMNAPLDVTRWAVIQTTRNVVTDDGRNMTPRDEWWHIPSFVVDEIERAAVRERDALREAAERAYGVLRRLDAQAAAGGGERGMVYVTVETWRLIVQPVIADLRALLDHEAGT